MAGYLGSKAVLLSTTAATVTGNATVGGSLTAASATISGDLTVDTDTLYVDSTNNRVGVGTTSPSEKLGIESTTNGVPVRIEFTAKDTGGTSRSGQVFFDADTDTVGFRNGNSNRLHVSSTGNILIGKTSADSGATAGVQLEPSGLGYFTRTGSSAVFNRLSTDGSIVAFRKDGTTVGSIGVTNSGVNVYYAGGTGKSGVEYGNSTWVPWYNGARSDDFIDIGSTLYRFDDVYATNGTIQTSDRNEKQDIAELDEAEKRVAIAAKGLIRKYRWKDAVAEKGDAARIHVGIIAQDLQDAFAAEGLDAHDYAMFISATWWEHDGQTYETAEEAPEGAVEKTRLGVRYPELLAFIIGAM